MRERVCAPFLLFVRLFILVRGPGSYSLDALIFRKRA